MQDDTENRPKYIITRLPHFPIGGYVVFNEQVQPKCLTGTKARINKVNRTTISLTLQTSCGSFKAGDTVRAPKHVLTRVD